MILWTVPRRPFADHSKLRYVKHMDEIDDLFGDVPQALPPVVEQPRPLTADDVRDRMVAIIASLREANVIPFPPDEFKKHRAMFPIMAQWLEPEDGEQLVFQFEAEVERLLAA